MKDQDLEKFAQQAAQNHKRQTSPINQFFKIMPKPLKQKKKNQPNERKRLESIKNLIVSNCLRPKMSQTMMQQ